MENAIVSLICGALILLGTVTVTMSSISSIDTVSDSWKQVNDMTTEAQQTDIAHLATLVSDNGTTVEIVIENSGDVSLDDFESWDVIVQYQEGSGAWLLHGPAAPGWTVGGISFGGSHEVFEPGILNPGEEMQLVLRLDPPMAPGTINRAIVSTPNGTTTEIMFGA